MTLPLVFDAPRRGRPPRHLADLTADERRDAVTALGLPAYRAAQLARWYFDGTDDPSGMTNIPIAQRAVLAEALLPALLDEVSHRSADSGDTRKSLWRCHDGALVESVLMRYPDRTTVCVSSQAGCGMACPFCATGQGGLTRNLSTAEIVDQVVKANRITRVSNVVFMGMGEPLANYESTISAIRRLTEKTGLGLAQRHITLSTIGLVPQLLRFAEEKLQVTLAVSLHAPDDELRDTLVPVNTRYPIAEVLDAAWHYADVTHRRVSIEYALIRDINDQAWRADLLGELLRGHLVHVNLIPLNPTPDSVWTASRRRDEDTFVARLEAAKIPVTVRDTRGRSVDAACGQLVAATLPGDISSPPPPAGPQPRGGRSSKGQ